MLSAEHRLRGGERTRSVRSYGETRTSGVSGSIICVGGLSGGMVVVMNPLDHRQKLT
jgi:hypothetical protein